LKNYLKYISPVIVIAGLYFIFKTSEITQQPGILASSPPIQEELKNHKTWIYKNHEITSIANFELKCRVLNIKSYGSDKMSDFAPLDIAAGWGKMSDQSIVDQIDIKQQHRWYVWQTKHFPIPRNELEISSTNIHIIPSSDEIEDQLDDVIRGNIIYLKGQLVNVKDDDSKFVWKTSTKRTDTGSGACEILWVENIDIIK
jgi:hypothetical protein